MIALNADGLPCRDGEGVARLVPGCPISGLSDIELRVEIAKALGRTVCIVGDKIECIVPGVLTFAPLYVPDWTSSIREAWELENILLHRANFETYVSRRRLLSDYRDQHLESWAGKSNARLICEAALHALRTHG